MAVRVTNWMNSVQYNAADDRLLISGLTTTPGVDGHRSLYVSQKATPSMKADISAGSAFIDGTSIAHQGQYHVYNDGTSEITFDPADSTRNRLDLVSLVIEDPEVTKVSPPVVKFVVTKGNPAASPVLPIAPPDSLSLASALIKKGQTKVSNTDIQNIAPRAVALGGIAYARNYQEMMEGLPKIDGFHVYRKDINRMMVCNGSSWEYINTSPSVDTGWMSIPVSSKYQRRKTEYRRYGDIVFTRGSITEYQKSKSKADQFNTIASINKKYAPPCRIQIMAGINTSAKAGAEFWEDATVKLYYTSPTSTHIYLNASWLLT